MYGSVPEAYFANQNVQRFLGTIETMTIANIRYLLSFEQRFVQWSSEGAPFRMEPTTMFDVAAKFFGKPEPIEDQIDQLQQRLDVQTKKRKSDDVEHDDTNHNAGGASKQQRPSQEDEAQPQTSNQEEQAQPQTSSSPAQGLSPSFNGEEEEETVRRRLSF